MTESQSQTKPSHQDLLDLYSQAETVDQELFAEQRSNLLLVSGDHYNNRSNVYWDRIRNNNDLAPEQKLRLTKNHLGKISEDLVNNIITYAPSVVATPNNEKENQDTKAAEMNNSVIQYYKVHDKWEDEVIEMAEDFIEIGEVARKLFWDPESGYVVREEQVIGADGEAAFDVNTGQPMTKKIWSGSIVSERVYGFNLLRHPAAKKMIGEHYPLIIRKMIDTKDLLRKFSGNPAATKYISETADKTYKIFDAANANYGDSKNQTLVLEYYYSKCPAYPNGYYFIITEAGPLAEGELPGGLFPIVYKGYRSVKTSPRHRSKIKQLRPYQVEINRTASKIAEHQITTGDVKLLVQANSQISSGAQIPGVRSVKYSGAKPEFLPGQVGAQYVDYMQSQITEMYMIAGVEEDSAEKPPENQGDMIQNVFRSLKQKKKHAVPAAKFESFCVDYWTLKLEIAKLYLPDEMLIPMIGRAEQVNIPEFKTTDKLCYSIKVEPRTDDLETQMGKTAIFSHILQYVGNQLDKKSIGQIVKQFPFGNWKQAFSEMTREEDIANNFILALDRGEAPLPNKHDDGIYMVRRLVDRKLQADFKQLDPQIQKNYDTYEKFYENMEAEKQRQIKMAESEFIPSGGARVGIDFYVPKAGDPTKTERAKVPAEAVDWLLKKLAIQGSSQEVLQELGTGAVAEIAGALNKQEGQQLVSSSNYGQANPGGNI